VFLTILSPSLHGASQIAILLLIPSIIIVFEEERNKRNG
jgi:hypothetical protein